MMDMKSKNFNRQKIITIVSGTVMVVLLVILIVVIVSSITAKQDTGQSGTGTQSSENISSNESRKKSKIEMPMIPLE